MKLVHLEQCCSLSTVIITDSYYHMMALLLALQVKLLQYGIWEHFQISDDHYIPFIHVEVTSLGVTLPKNQYMDVVNAFMEKKGSIYK